MGVKGSQPIISLTRWMSTAYNAWFSSKPQIGEQARLVAVNVTQVEDLEDFIIVTEIVHGQAYATRLFRIIGNQVGMAVHCHQLVDIEDQSHFVIIQNGGTRYP